MKDTMAGSSCVHVGNRPVRCVCPLGESGFWAIALPLILSATPSEVGQIRQIKDSTERTESRWLDRDILPLGLSNHGLSPTSQALLDVKVDLIGYGYDFVDTGVIPDLVKFFPSLPKLIGDEPAPESAIALRRTGNDTNYLRSLDAEKNRWVVSSFNPNVLVAEPEQLVWVLVKGCAETESTAAA